MPARTWEIRSRKSGARVALREELIQTALSLFIDHGVGNITIKHIAEECKVTQGAVHWYFSDKAELIHEVEEFWMLQEGMWCEEAHTEKEMKQHFSHCQQTLFFLQLSDASFILACLAKWRARWHMWFDGMDKVSENAEEMLRLSLGALLWRAKTGSSDGAWA